jgi:hypothetical protein
MKVALINLNQPNRPTIKGHNNLIFVFNAESPTNIAVQNETEEGIIQATAGYSITMNCSVSSGMPNETMIWRYNNTVVGVGGPAFISWRSYLLVEETEVLKENHRTAASH